MSLRHARDIIESWRRDYNEVRLHSLLNDQTPMEYAETAAVGEVLSKDNQ